MKYERSLFGMKISDAMSLAKCVKATDTLTSVVYVHCRPFAAPLYLQRSLSLTLSLTHMYRLPCNMIDDDLLRMLMTGLVHNQTITHLGTRSIGDVMLTSAYHLVPPRCTLATDLSYNKITAHGVRLLSKIVGSKSVVMSLNLCDNQVHTPSHTRLLTHTPCSHPHLLALLLRSMPMAASSWAVP